MERTLLYSQYLDIENRPWQGRACGIASLAMLLNNKSLNLDQLYQLGLNQGAYVQGVGWTHLGLVNLAKHFGYAHSYNLDLAQMEMVDALACLKTELKKGPVMASIFTSYEPGHKDGHLIVLLSLNEKEAEVLDPDTLVKKQVYQVIPRPKFIAGWKKRLIIIRK